MPLFGRMPIGCEKWARCDPWHRRFSTGTQRNQRPTQEAQKGNSLPQWFLWNLFTSNTSRFPAFSKSVDYQMQCTKNSNSFVNPFPEILPRIRYCEWNLKLVLWLFPRSLAATTTSSSWSPLPRPSEKSNWKFSATLGREKQRWSSPLKPDTSLDFSGGAKSHLHLSKTIHPGILTNTECCYM